MIFGAILAGGTGSRMGLTNMPKQFLELGDKPIIIHTLQKFLLNLKFDVIYLGVHENWTGYMEDLIEKYIVDEENKNRKENDKYNGKEQHGKRIKTLQL